jgi:hypothetical protein
MKTKIGIYLTEDVARRFKVATRRLGQTKSDLVNEALRVYFDPPAPEKDQGEVALNLVKGLAKRIRRMQREAEVAGEMLALFVRYYLMITPPLHESERPSAEALGRERYAIFIRQIASRVTSDKGMLADVIRTIVATHPHLVAEVMAEARRRDAIGDLFPANGHATQPAEHAENLAHA